MNSQFKFENNRSKNLRTLVTFRIFEKGAKMGGSGRMRPQNDNFVGDLPGNSQPKFKNNRSKNLRALVIFRIFEKGSLKWTEVGEAPNNNDNFVGHFPGNPQPKFERIGQKICL